MATREPERQRQFTALRQVTALAGAGIQFADGLRCAGGGVIRLQVRFADASGWSATTAAVALKGGVSAGDTKRYQLWYRDPQSTICGTGFNLSNGYEVVWQP